ncbi:hypothetical protein [Actinokineospora sp.]|uniref:hypothetical protein n=1 Tax=Actinokineospora sp. TaxID=1872133 RepID=UPI004037EBFA
MADEDRDDDEADDEDEESEEGIPHQVQTVCHYCGGGGMIADPKLAIVGGIPRTVDNGRPCHVCATVGHFPGIVPPV